MTNPVIRATNLSKEYVVGSQEAASMTLREAVTSVAASVGNRLKGNKNSGDRRAITDKFWALSDITFEIMPGEVVGIIGRNGAGKSTLLKILSRITAPTRGRVEIRGRIASLLEVGTGFHPELTGRENVRLNGAILGMTRAEINAKFDEIVAFAGVEKFIDTPVKRYSSGMQVRLAFAVAAHLDPEILIVDEVLAVGDAEFQKKCLGKMGEISAKGGRTVLFVSHQLAAVQALCSQAILLAGGKVIQNGRTADVIDTYMRGASHSNNALGSLSSISRQGAGKVRFGSCEILDEHDNALDAVHTGKSVKFRFKFTGLAGGARPARVGMSFSTLLDVPLFICATEASFDQPLYLSASDELTCSIRSFPLAGGAYKINLFLEREGVIEDWIRDGLTLPVEDAKFFAGSRNLPMGWEGKSVLVANEWKHAKNVETP